VIVSGHSFQVGLLPPEGSVPEACGTPPSGGSRQSDRISLLGTGGSSEGGKISQFDSFERDDPGPVEGEKVMYEPGQCFCFS